MYFYYVKNVTATRSGRSALEYGLSSRKFNVMLKVTGSTAKICGFREVSANVP
jgi:hypothetical protein